MERGAVLSCKKVSAAAICLPGMVATLGLSTLGNRKHCKFEQSSKTGQHTGGDAQSSERLQCVLASKRYFVSS